MIDRTEWISALTQLPAKELLSFTETISKNWEVSAKAIPQSGLGMLKLEDSAFGEPFFLGEFPLSTAWIEIKTNDGKTAEGAAQVMDDRTEYAEALALIDAILSSQLPGWEQAENMVKQGIVKRNAIHTERKQMLAKTQVDFSLLDDVGDDDA